MGKDKGTDFRFCQGSVHSLDTIPLYLGKYSRQGYAHVLAAVSPNPQDLNHSFLQNALHLLPGEVHPL